MTYTVHVEWMGIVIISGREDDSDVLVGRKDEGVFGDVEIGGGCGTCKNFVKSRALGWEIRDAVDVPLSLSGGLKHRRTSSVQA